MSRHRSTYLNLKEFSDLPDREVFAETTMHYIGFCEFNWLTGICFSSRSSVVLFTPENSKQKNI